MDIWQLILPNTLKGTTSMFNAIILILLIQNTDELFEDGLKSESPQQSLD